MIMASSLHTLARPSLLNARPKRMSGSGSHRLAIVPRATLSSRSGSLVGLLLSLQLAVMPMALALPFESSPRVENLIENAKKGAEEAKAEVEQNTLEGLDIVSRTVRPQTDLEAVRMGGAFGYKVVDEAKGAANTNVQECTGRMQANVPLEPASESDAAGATNCPKK